MAVMRGGGFQDLKKLANVNSEDLADCCIDVPVSSVVFADIIVDAWAN